MAGSTQDDLWEQKLSQGIKARSEELSLLFINFRDVIEISRGNMLQPPEEFNPIDHIV